ncbi:hypothetical protein C0Q70_09700 [Pomacea canaliculata]|uniref:Uncharacterized protein n=1 Tax=Pomacea canaliculata TaxID=400727 RepID=A0A2T7PAI3_POMCA|nr:hypothetical protein C0Q70_09700 [Pomacea canaliculata]
MTKANNGTESEDQKVTISEPTDFPQSRPARRKSLRNHRTKTKKSSRVNSFDVRGDFNLSKDIQGDDNSFHEALLNESAADDFSVTRSRKLNQSITVAPALSRASRVNVSAYISNLISWEGSPVLSRGCRLKHLNMTSMVFVKVHKSASSTIANILARYALSNTGLAPEKQRDPRNIRNHAISLRRDLDLVLVAENFEESLVLLKRRACLRMKDILYMKNNARKNKTEFVMSSKDRLLFKKYQMADVLLYDHFYRIFWDNVLAEGIEFFLELRRFREIQAIMSEFCFRNTSGLRLAYVDASMWNERFVISRRDCFLLQQSEMSMQIYLLSRATKWLALSEKDGV